MMPRGLFESRMLAMMGEFFPSLCEIQEPPTDRDDYGQIVETVDDDWTTVAAMESIPCQIAALNANERQRLTGPVATATHRIALRGIYSAITAKMRAEVGGEHWGILGASVDSQNTYTRLLVEQVTV